MSQSLVRCTIRLSISEPFARSRQGLLAKVISENGETPRVAIEDDEVPEVRRATTTTATTRCPVLWPTTRPRRKT